jgi:hypothetical protein
MQIMQIRLACSDQLFSNSDGERQVGKSVSVQVADFALPHSKEDDAAAMSVHGNLRPGSHFVLNSYGDRFRQDLYNIPLTRGEN